MANEIILQKHMNAEEKNASFKAIQAIVNRKTGNFKRYQKHTSANNRASMLYLWRVWK